MQTSNPVQVRPPWPDELPRVQNFLPFAFLFEADPFLLIAVSGKVERIIGALALSRTALAHIRAPWLVMRVENNDPVGAALLEQGLTRAWTRGAQRVYFGQTFDENSAEAKALQAAGFMPEVVHEVYESDSREIFARVERMHARLRARNLIPPKVEVTTLLPAVIPKVRQFLVENMPQSASMIAIQNAAYRPEHSYALFVDGAVKGLLLSQRVGNVSRIGLRVVAEELRGRFGWANVLLVHTALAAGLRDGLEISRFEFNPEEHEDTGQYARLSGARRVGRRILFSRTRPLEWS
jgi:hypothetical protein